MRSRLLAIADAWREDWRAITEGSRVIVILLLALFLAFAGFAIWFSSSYEF